MVLGLLLLLLLGLQQLLLLLLLLLLLPLAAWGISGPAVAAIAAGESAETPAAPLNLSLARAACIVCRWCRRLAGEAPAEAAASSRRAKSPLLTLVLMQSEWRRQGRRWRRWGRQWGEGNTKKFTYLDDNKNILCGPWQGLATSLPQVMWP
jgi:hypothetical protein